MKTILFFGLLLFQLVQGYADPVYSAYPAKILTDKDYEIAFQKHEVELRKQQITEKRRRNTRGILVVFRIIIKIFVLFNAKCM